MPADTDTPSLAEVQRRFWELVTAPEDVHATLRARGIEAADLARMIRGDERLSAAQRLDIYANMYFFRIRDVLRDDYPRLLALVGDDAFHNLATDFLAAQPPRHFSLARAGVALPGFLARHALVDKWPFAADLARLERARLDVFEAADAETLALDDLRARDPETFASLSLQLIPAQHVYTARFAVVDAWRALEHEPDRAPDVAACDCDVVVWRQQPYVYHRALDDDERALWPLLAEGAQFGVVCTKLAERLPDAEVAARAFALLSRWVQDGLLMKEDEAG